MLIAGNWKMFKGPPEAAGSGDRDPPLPTRAAASTSSSARRSCRSRRAAGLERQRLPSTRRTSTGSRGRVHRRGLGADAARARRPRRDRRPLGAPAALRRDRRDGARCAPRRALEAGSRVIACVGETEAEREAGETEEVLAPVRCPCSPRTSAWWSPTSRCGRSARARRRRPRSPRRRTRSSRRCSTRRSSTAARSSRRTPPSCSPSRTWTARSSAAPRSTSNPSTAICRDGRRALSRS